MKKHLLKLSTFASLPLLSLAAISCSNNQNIPPRDHEMINFETGLAFNSKGEITKYYYYDTNDYTNIVVPEYLVNNRLLTSEYYGYKQRITSIGNMVFSAQTKYDGASGQYKPIYNEYAQYLTSITLPNSIESIGGDAFRETPLTEIILPDSVVTIGGGAFQYCTNLTSVKLSKNTKYIGFGAFSGTGITSIEIPNSVLYIESNAFYNTKLSGSLHIPDSVVTIDARAFEGTQLKEVSISKDCWYSSSAFPSNCVVTRRP
ncbi:leucine-rich repeat protein [Metamycoplasma sualvi]|uniref:leucine-rich repeat domain-containing protein n=1 Tax=Metamycoplasma sualvi TaxID=2125 RepID=UPI003872B617